MQQRSDHLNEPVLAFAKKEFTTLSEELTVRAALDLVRQNGVSEQIIYFYVVNRNGQLTGVLPTRRLLTAPLDQRLAEIAIARVVSIPHGATVMEACELFLLYKFLAFPIIDEQKKILGVVDVSLFSEEVLDFSEKERMNDVFQAIGFHVAQVQAVSPMKSFRHRFPWLLATMGGGILCAFLAGAYESTLSRSLVLAMFLALVLGLGESVSVQSLTVTIQSLHGRTLSWRWFLRAALKELITAAMLGGASAVIVGAIVWMWRGAGLPAAVIGGSLFLAICAACLVGLIIPSLLHRFRLDPKIAAGPVALALADVLTLLLYFNLARWAL